MENETEVLNGSVEEVPYFNEENGFTVLEIGTDNETVSAVGVMPAVVPGEYVRLEGNWQIHQSFGRQFRVTGCVCEMPSGVAGMLRYLSSGIIKGIGESTARKIVDKFGENTFDVIENDCVRLAQIKGLTEKKAEDISKQFSQQQKVRNIMDALREYGMTPTESMRAYKVLGANIEKEFEKNPYVMCDDGIDMSFERADEIAMKLPIRPHEMLRIMAGIKHILRHNLGNGHTCIPRDKVTEPAKNLLDCDTDEAEIAVDNLISTEEIIEDQLGGRDFLFLPYIYDAERTIAAKMKMFVQYPPAGIPVSDELMRFAENNLKIKFQSQQEKAIKISLEKGLLILTGGPGTGKTTALKGIISLMQRQNLKILLSAPTGRAAKRITEITGVEAKTIHRLLGAQYSAGGKMIFQKNERDPLETDAIIIDEISMVDVTVFSALLEALPLGCRIIMVGDFDQLPPVGAGNILQDIMSWGKIDTVRLTEIFRQAMKSSIITNSHRIVKGQMPDITSNDNDFFFISEADRLYAQQTVTDLAVNRLPKAYKFNPVKDIQILCASHLGETGTLSLNLMLQEKLNPPQKGKKNLKRRGFTLREGDKVMQIRNNYDIPYVSLSGESEGSGVFNGDIGILSTVDFRNSSVKVVFDDKIAVYPMDSCSDLELAYAVTVHKSQGSEFDAVIMPLVSVPKPLEYRNLLYTAVTRAKKILVIVGRAEELKAMVENDRKAKRFSALKYFLGEE